MSVALSLSDRPALFLVTGDTFNKRQDIIADTVERCGRTHILIDAVQFGMNDQTRQPTPQHPPGAAIDDETSPSDFGDGLVINTSVLLRWPQESDFGVGDDILLVIDGERELRVEGSLLQYRDGDLGVLCFDVGTDNVSCVGQPSSGTLTAGLDVGREAFCVFVSISEDASARTCSDTETGILLMIETTGKTLTGQETFVTRELVEWSTSDEIDFALIAEAQAALDEIRPADG